MSEYSGYKPTRAHALGPFASVHEAAAPDGGPGRFALKIFHPPPSSDIRRVYALEGWLLAAERQQKGAKKDGAVLEVVAFGRCPEGAYMVTPWQEHSLEPLVATLAAKGDVLRALAECLFDALEQWGVQTGGSHRKLKPANVFLTGAGPLQGRKAVLSDPWFLPGGKSGTAHRDDLASVGAILAQIVRRREVAAWPIEDAPEWKALGRPGKAWLACVNHLLDPEPASGELTLAEARRRLKAIPKDARPVRNAILIGSGVMLLAVGGLLAFARLGDPRLMPLNIRKLAETVKNPRTIREDVTPSWARLCQAWDTWLGDLQGNAPRLLRTESLWSGPNDPLRTALANFNANANSLLPGSVIPEAAGERRLTVLGDTPPPAVLGQLRLQRVSDEVDAAYAQVNSLALQLETWTRWEELRKLLALIETRGFTRAASALQPKLPQARGTAGYKLDMARTLRLLKDVSLDDRGTLLLASRWSEMTRLTADMEASTDRVQVAMPALIRARLLDHASLGDFADSLADPLEEMRRRRQLFLDPQVVRERFLKESVLQTETAAPTAADFPRWEEQLALFSKVPAADDPRQAQALDASLTRLPQTAADLEADAPVPEPGGLATLTTADFNTEFQGRRTELTALRGREIVRIDLPAISAETTKLADAFRLLEQRVEYTLTLLKPEIWLAKVAQAHGKFNETKQRWAAWQQAALTGVTPATLEGAANRPRFRDLRRQERALREWIDGLEGPEGLGALIVPELSSATDETADALRQLESARREQAASAVASAAEWRSALPVAAWTGASAAVREPIEAHRSWLAALPAFGVDLDGLRAFLEGGFSWNEGVSEVMDRLARHAGLDALAGPPAERTTEARLLGQLFGSNDRAELVAAAQSGGLSRKFTAWRRLGGLTGWPAGAEDLDVDGAVVAVLRETIGRDVRDTTRRGTLIEELTRETRVRWNRAARNSAANEAQLSAVFERMARYGLGEADLEPPALYNLKLWQLKRSDWSEVDIGPLRSRRDGFVAAVRGIGGVAAQPAVAGFVRELAAIEMVVDTNRAPTPSPRLAGWTEELTDDGLGLSATWRGGGKNVKLDFHVVQPPDGSAPFYLARREIAVGEFLDLMAARPSEATGVMAELPGWAKGDSLTRPFNQPMSWRPQENYRGLELNPGWFHFTTAQVKGLFDDAALRAQTPSLDQAAAEKPTPRSPLQQIPPGAAKLFVEKMLGARLPTAREWDAIMKTVGPAGDGNFRGASFQSLFNYLRDYNVAGQTLTWRPNTGAFQVAATPPGGGRPVALQDDGRAAPGTAGNRMWLAPVDDGPASATGGFVNLTGNVWIYLQGDGPEQFFVAGGSALSPPGIDLAQPQKVEPRGLIGAKRVTEGFSDVGIRPAFDAPPGFRERYKLLVLVREQNYLTW